MMLEIATDCYRDVKGSYPSLHPRKRGLLFTFLRNFIIGYLSHPLDRVSIEKDIGRSGFNLWIKYRRQRGKEKDILQ